MGAANFYFAYIIIIIYFWGHTMMLRGYIFFWWNCLGHSGSAQKILMLGKPYAMLGTELCMQDKHLNPCAIPLV